MTHTKDRDYYRCQPDSALHEEVQRGINPNWPELAVVLAERLSDAHYKYDALRYDYREAFDD